MARRKVKNGEKSPWGQCLTRPVPNGRCRPGFWLVPQNFCVFLPNQKPERRRPFGTGLVRHCPQGFYSLFFVPYFSACLDFPSHPLSAPRSPRMGLLKMISLLEVHVLLEMLYLIEVLCLLEELCLLEGLLLLEILNLSELLCLSQVLAYLVLTFLSNFLHHCTGFLYMFICFKVYYRWVSFSKENSWNTTRFFTLLTTQ